MARLTLKQELVVATAMVAFMWLLYAGMTGYIEYLDNRLVESGINVMELVR